jgi:hypothetical protein
MKLFKKSFFLNKNLIGRIGYPVGKLLLLSPTVILEKKNFYSSLKV